MPEKEEDWERTILRPLTGGYNISESPSAIKESFSPHIENVVFNRGRVEGDFGFADLDTEVRGIPRMVYQFDKKSGLASEILLLTNLTLYGWVHGAWHYVQGTAGTTLSSEQAAGQTTMEVASDTDFSDGDFVGIILDNLTQHKTTVNGSPVGDVITITDAIPTGRTAPNGGAVLRAVVLTGTDQICPTMATFPASDTVLIANGSDNVQRYDASDCIDVPNLVTGVGGGNAYARIVRVKDNKVNLYNTNENGTDFPQRVRWSATGDLTDWTTSGDAGYEDLYGDEDYIVAAEELGPYIIVYRERSRYRQEYVGSSTLIYNFEKTGGGDGAASANSIITRDTFHIVLGGQGFYIYDGGYSIEEFGREIWEKVFGDQSNLDFSLKYKWVAVYIESLKEYWFLVVTDGQSWPDLIWRYSVQDSAWTTRVFGIALVNMDSIDLPTGVETWNSASGAWEADAWDLPWNDLSLRASIEVILMSGFLAADGSNYTFRYEDTYTDDDGATIVTEFQTKALTRFTGKIRLNKLECRIKGTSIIVSYSIDEGDNWTEIETTSPGSEYITQTIWKQLVSDSVMFKFVGGHDFGLEWIMVEQAEEGDW